MTTVAFGLMGPGNLPIRCADLKAGTQWIKTIFNFDNNVRSSAGQ